MKWKKLKSFDDLPKKKSFLIWDKNATSGIWVYEALIDGNEAFCPASHTPLFKRGDFDTFSHWCKIKRPKGKK